MAGGGSDGDGTIKMFKYIQKTFKNVGIFPVQSNCNRISSKNWFILFCHAQFIVSSAAYLLFQANSMIEYGTIFFLCSTILFYMIVYMTFIWETRNILSYIENCERFIETRMDSKIVYKDASEKIERLSEFFAYAMCISAIFLVLPDLLFTMVNYLILDLGSESFFLFCPIWWPFDWKTPFGYLTAWIAQCAAVATATSSAISFYNFVFGSNWIFIVFAEDITNDMIIFNRTIQTVKDGRRVKKLKLIKCFCDIMQNYSDAKQCVNDFNKICEYSLFAFFAWNIFALSSLLITSQLKLWDDDSKLFQIMILSMVSVWLIVINLAVCEPGQRVAHRFEQFAMEIGQCEWSKLSTEMQQIYLIFLLDIQQPTNIQSYGRIECTRETFKQITTKEFSYFMTLRNFRA